MRRLRRQHQLTLGDVAKSSRPYVKAALDQGWTLRRGSKHLLLCPPDGGPAVPVYRTDPPPWNHRNAIATLRRRGVQL